MGPFLFLEKMTELFIFIVHQKNSLLMKNWIHIFCFSLMGLSAQAQYTGGGGGAVSLGIQTLSTSEFTAFDPNAPELNQMATSIGGYGYFQVNNWLFGFKGAGNSSAKQIVGDYEYSAGSGYFLLDFGYKVVNKQKLFVYPFVGVGWGGASYSIDSKFTINLDDPNNQRPVIYSGKYNWSNVVFDAGVRVEQLFGIKTRGAETGGGLIGLEAGYMFSPTNTNWRTNANATINGAPEYNMNGFYARLLIGGFGGY